MMDKNKLNTMKAANAVESWLRKELEQFNGTVSSNQVKSKIVETLADCEARGILAQSNEPPHVEVNILWEKWNLKQKAKWLLFNKVPGFKHHTRVVRKLIDDHNSNIFDFNREMERIADEIREEFEPYSTLEYPEHMTVGPKTIVITDLRIRPVQSVDFIRVDIELDAVKQ